MAKVTVSTGNFGRSPYTGNVIKKQIVINKTGSKSSGGSSSSSSNYRISGGQVIDRKTGKRVNLKDFGGNLNKAIESLGGFQTPALPATVSTGGAIAERAKQEGGFRLSGGDATTAGGKFKSLVIKDPRTGKNVIRPLSQAEIRSKGSDAFRGVIQGKVYAGVSQAEVLAQRLSPYTRARELKNESARRQAILDAQLRKAQGKATTYDIYNISTDFGRRGILDPKSLKQTQQFTKQESDFRSEANKKAKEESQKFMSVKDFAKASGLSLGESTTFSKDPAITKAIQSNLDYLSRIGTRSERAIDIFRAVPLLKGDNWVQRATRYLLAVRTLMTIGATEITLAGLKNWNIWRKQILNPVTREEGIKALERSAIRTPSSFIQSLDARKPEGFVNLGLILTAFVPRGKVLNVNDIAKAPKSQIPIRVIVDKKGRYAIQTKSGRIVRVPKQLNKAIAYANKVGSRARASTTEIARITQKNLKGRASFIEKLKLQSSAQAKTQKITTAQINKEVSQVLRGKSATSSQKARFKEAYSNYRKRPTKFNANKLQRITEIIESQKGVRAIDQSIIRRINIAKQKQTQILRAKELQRKRSLAGKKGSQARANAIKTKTLGFKKGQKVFERKVSSQINPLLKGKRYSAGQKAELRRLYSEYLQRPSDALAKKIEFLAERIEVQTAVRNVDKIILRNLNRPISKKRLFDNAIFLLKQGKIKVSPKGIKKVPKERAKLSSASASIMSSAISKKLAELERIAIDKEARISLRKIQEGKTLELSAKVKSKINDLIRRQEFYSIRMAKSKKVSPLSKAQKKAIRKQALAPKQTVSTVLDIRRVAGDSLSKGEFLEVSPKGRLSVYRLDKNFKKVFLPDKSVSVTNQVLSYLRLKRSQGVPISKVPKYFRRLLNRRTSVKRSMKALRKELKKQSSASRPSATTSLDIRRVAGDSLSKGEFLEVSPKGRLSVYRLDKNFKKVFLPDKSVSVTNQVLSYLRLKRSQGVPISKVPKYFRRLLNRRTSVKRSMKALRKELRRSSTSSQSPTRVFNVRTEARKYLDRKQEVLVTKSGRAIVYKLDRNFKRNFDLKASKMVNSKILDSLKRKILNEGLSVENIPRFFRKRLSRRLSSSALRKIKIKGFRKSVQQSELQLKSDVESGKFNVVIDADGSVKLVPKTSIGQIRFVKDIVQKKAPSPNAVKVNKNGVVSVLRTDKVRKVVSRSKIKNARLSLELKAKLIKNLKRAKQIQKVASSLKKKVSSKSVIKKVGVRAKSSVRASQSLSSASISATASLTSVALARSQIQNQIKALTQSFASIPAIALATNSASVIIQDIKRIVDNIPARISGVRFKLNQFNVPKLELLQVFPRRPVKTRRIIKPEVPKKVIAKLPKLTWEKKLPRGYSFIVDGIVRSKGVNKVIRLRTTPNRALRRITPLIDNSLSRSFQLKIVGIKKIKDVKKPSLRKFRSKISRGTPVLNVVEKTRFALDRSGEKRRIQIERLLRSKKLRFRSR